MQDLLIIDLEMCRVDRNVIKGRGVYLDYEIIEIGAVILGKKNRIRDEFKTYVRPEYGNLDEFISDLTGIREIDLGFAPALKEALEKLAGWLQGREITACSWSDTDLIQLSVEMEQKKIENAEIRRLLDGWVDLQRSYDMITGAGRPTSLERAMRAEGVRPEGRAHDGAADARNTALLIARLLADGKELEMHPVNEVLEYHDEDDGACSGNPFFNIRF